VADAALPGFKRERIEHIIVLLMENRSFDHLLGYLRHEDPKFPNLELIRPSCAINPDRPNGRRVPTADDATSVLGTDPDHSHLGVMLQLFGRGPTNSTPTMDGFIASYASKIAGDTPRPWWKKAMTEVTERVKSFWRWIRRRPGPTIARPDDIMKCFAESEIPVMAFLAKQFAVLINWYASVPGATWPNRQFAHAATSGNTVNNKPRFYYDDTVFQRLEEADPERSWGIYSDGVAQVWAYQKLWVDGVDEFHDIDQLYLDIANNVLPAYAFVEPNHGFGRGVGNSQHPGDNTIVGDSFQAGEALMARIYNALVDQPDLFAKTMLLITYDEHGGFFDHESPPEVPSPDGAIHEDSGFDFRRCGVRVPAVAISPLIPAGTVDETCYEHSSIPATVRKQFAPDTPPLTDRDAAAEDFLERLPLLPRPRTDLQHVAVDEPSLAFAETAKDQYLNEFQATLVELAGAVHNARQRTTRPESPEPPGPVPYQPDVSTEVAAQTRVLVPGSEADQVIDEVVADFTGEGPGPDPVDVEFGPR